MNRITKLGNFNKTRKKPMNKINKHFNYRQIPYRETTRDTPFKLRNSHKHLNLNSDMKHECNWSKVS